MSAMVYLNGRLIPRDQASISALDYGYLYGFGLFETMRAYSGRVFLLDSHLRRLADSAEALGFSLAGLDLKGAVMDTLRANGLGDARVRITVSAGEGAMAPDPASCNQPTVLIQAEDYRPCAEKVYRKGFSVVTASFRRNSLSPLSRYKSTSYLDSILARQQAREAGADEALCLNEKGLLAEASMSNIFLVTAGAVRTPGLECGILPGITRQAVLNLAQQMGINTLEQDIQPDELLDADEVFLTGSLVEVMPVTSIDGKLIASGKPGRLTGRLMAAYKKLVISTTGT